MPNRDAHDARLRALRKWRTKADPDQGLGFVRELFKQQIEKPHKQLAAVAEAWRRLIPPDLLEHTRLDSLSRGVLHVSVTSSAKLYELDRLLRGGREQQIIQGCGAKPPKRIMLRVTNAAAPGAPGASGTPAPRKPAPSD